MLPPKLNPGASNSAALPLQPMNETVTHKHRESSPPHHNPSEPPSWPNFHFHPFLVNSVTELPCYKFIVIGETFVHLLHP
jgi:hypothetical protein